ncbi:MAG: ATP-binding protein [Acutalibacteraceae bacterium]
MKTNAEDISAFMSDEIIVKEGKTILKDYDETVTLLTDLGNNLHYDIVLTDYDGKVLATTKNYENIVVDKNIDADVMEKIQANKIFEADSSKSFFGNTKYTVGVPVHYRIGISTSTTGFIFLCSSNNIIGNFIFQIIVIFIFAAIAAFVLAFAFAGFYAYSVVKPLKEMSMVTHAFANGDFKQRMNVHSKDEIGMLATSFNEMAEALDSSEEVRKTFIANVSHELKTPMTTISGFIDGILDGTIPPNMEKGYLRIVSKEIERLNRLVSSMLSLSRIDNGSLKIYPKKFDLLPVVVNILLLFEPTISEKNIHIKGLDKVNSFPVKGDKDLLHQVIYNLVENAVKFTPEKGDIAFNFTKNDKNDIISISNTGVGIKKDDLRFIFDKFYKTDKSRSKDKKGMGLGLYIVRQIVRLHGGEITASSKENGPTVFTVALPCQDDGE